MWLTTSTLIHARRVLPVLTQRQLLASDDFTSLHALASQIPAFEQHYNAAARPFEWKFTRADLNQLLTRPPGTTCRSSGPGRAVSAVPAN